jgi:hypothetical protein
MYKILEKKTTQRLAYWYELRQHLENSKTPFDDVFEFFKQFPKVKVYTDPYDNSTWPTAWELIEENEYCPFNLILGICYTLQLCECFKHITPKITITIDNTTNSVYYLLFVEDVVYGYEDSGWIPAKNLPKSLKNIKIYNMPPLH